MSSRPIRIGLAGNTGYAALRFPLRPGEGVLVTYFVYTAAMACMWDASPYLKILTAAIPVSLAALAWAATRNVSKAAGVAREWIVSLPLLLAYQQIDWFGRLPHEFRPEHGWIRWDRLVLDEWRLRALMESLGPVLPCVTEFAYLMIYAIPPVCLWILYKNHLRSRVDQFLFTFLTGTLLAYALLPHFPTEAPRTLFPGEDLPRVATALHRVNLWMLNGADIRASVFPSGHVAAAFSAAFGLLLAFPERKRYGLSLLAVAVAILVDTVYARYHYLADGVAGVLIAFMAALFGATVMNPARLSAPAAVSEPVLQADS